MRRLKYLPPGVAGVVNAGLCPEGIMNISAIWNAGAYDIFSNASAISNADLKFKAAKKSFEEMKNVNRSKAFFAGNGFRTESTNTAFTNRAGNIWDIIVLLKGEGRVESKVLWEVFGDLSVAEDKQPPKT